MCERRDSEEPVYSPHLGVLVLDARRDELTLEAAEAAVRSWLIAYTYLRTGSTARAAEILGLHPKYLTRALRAEGLPVPPRGRPKGGGRE